MKKTFLIFLLLSNIVFGQTLPIGDWKGKLDVSGVEFTLLLHMQQNEKGDLTATIDALEQEFKEISVENIHIDGNKLSFSVEKFKATFNGTITKKEIIGNFTQKGMQFPLTFIHNHPTHQINQKRPQEPVAPFPYSVEDISYKNSSDGNILSGTLILPQKKGSFPIVFLITGSGPCDRNESIYGHKPFLVLSDHLARQGIASLRIDKRGIGKSTGNFATATSGDFKNDILAGIEYLKTRKEINQKRIGLLGHSEGGAIAPMVAAESKDIAFLVMMAGPTVSGEELLYEQGALLQRTIGMSEEQIQKDRKFRETLFSIIKNEPNFQKAKQQLQIEAEKHFSHVEVDINASEGIAIIRKENINEAVQRIASPWFRYFLTLDPSQYLKKVHVPILALAAEKDLQVPPRQNLPVLTKTLEEINHRDYTILKLSNLNHLFQSCDKGLISEYSMIDETISPTALNAISHWILEKTSN